MTRQEAEILLSTSFKIDSFYDEQWETIEKLLNKERVLLIEKTGFGKSLCFQFPAIIFEGTTVVFSPLIALMRDQVKKLNSLGISAKCINSEQTQEENAQIINEAKKGEIKILYIAPERQENTEWIEATRLINLSMLVIDEAHCISVWGHDFRPSFRRIINLVNLLPNDLPILATTATATNKVELDIARQMRGNLTVIRGSLLRNNLRLFVVKVNSEDEKLIWLGKNIEKIGGSGLLYTGTRVDTEIYCRWFTHLNIKSIGYNAGLDSESRISIENGLINNDWKCVVSTNALGMGIDKPDIRFIIHTQIPQSPIHYYQEIGRAGRDGKAAYIILFYNPEDRKLPEAFIEGGRPPVSKYEKVIDLLKTEMLGLRDITRKMNCKQTPIEIIIADLLDQKIILKNSKNKYELKTNAPQLDSEIFEELRNIKHNDLDKMIEYVETDQSRMKFLCDYLGDNSITEFNNCDNTGLKKIIVETSSEWQERLQAFRENYFPKLDVEAVKTNLINGIAASYYGFPNVGDAIHRSKYGNAGDYPDFLLKLTLQAFRKKFGQEVFDIILYVPSTKSGDLVKNFAIKISQVLKFPISHDLIKIKQTQEQRILENKYLKTDNVKNAFLFKVPDEIKGKSILLIDDIIDSGATIKEIGKHLTNLGAAKIAPLIIAKTVKGDVL
ncbi:MAG: DNA helicase II [Bacteroidetes bacterium GWE2_29_8]|nr:MAG: DNA helicase II [Bacteroidetes bacterium GWE2_29_8]OFY22741.1 MAG: DNA helicase II [Bacteroidetes bacterium GWF2_29_10]